MSRAPWHDRRIAAIDPFEATSTEGGQPEVEPHQVQMTDADIAAIWSSVEDLYRTGLHPAIGLCIRKHGHVIIDRAIGHIRGNAPGEAPNAPRIQARPDSLFNIFSASKAVTAMLIHLLDERGVVSVDDPVAKWIPEFARHGKDWITLRHVLCHRAGIPRIPRDRARLEMLSDWEGIIELLCDSAPQHRIGRTLAYHALTGGWILGEVLQRATGRDLREFIATEVMSPLGIEHMNYGTTPENLDRVAQHALTGPPVLFPMTKILERALGVPFERAIEYSNDPRFLTSVVPAGNIIGTPNEVSLFFEMLLRGGALGDVRVFSERTIERATAEQTNREIDVTFGIPMRYSMGFVLGDRWVSIYGTDTAETFGHLGFTTITAYADRARDISVCLATSGKHFLTPRLWQHLQVLRAINNRCAKVPR
mgnify:CR=1 FL=1